MQGVKETVDLPYNSEPSRTYKLENRNKPTNPEMGLLFSMPLKGNHRRVRWFKLKTLKNILRTEHMAKKFTV